MPKLICPPLSINSTMFGQREAHGRRSVLLRRFAQFLAGLACEIPRQQFVDAVDRMLGDALEHERRYASGSRPLSLAVPIRL